MKKVKFPAPWFGGKSKVASLVWDRLGDPQNYIEPFIGSGAVLLARPHAPRVETLNDLDCRVANFWRASQADPDAVAHHADWPVSEIDLHARHRHLVLSGQAKEFRERMLADPDYYDARFAGWWIWGLSCWIGSGWCASAEPSRQLPMLSGDAGASGRGVHAVEGGSRCEERRAWLLNWISRLRDRLRTVRVCCGDWSRVCNSPSTMTALGTTAVFLDPPYPLHDAGGVPSRVPALYATDAEAERLNALRDEVLSWCHSWGAVAGVRVAVCGLAGDGYEALEQDGWECVAWTSSGYGNQTGGANRRRERLWFSPQCLPSASEESRGSRSRTAANGARRGQG